MSDIWRFGSNFETDMKFFVEVAPDISPITVTHFFDATAEGDRKLGMYGGHLGNRPSPAAELILLLEDFDDDFFNWGGALFVSERMRHVMALDRSEVRYLEVDDSRSAALPRSKKYMLMEPTVMEAALDPDACDYFVEPFESDGYAEPLKVMRYVIRPDVAPKHDLFYDSFFIAELLCTDRFAKLLQAAGCTGVDFVEPRADGPSSEELHHTMRELRSRAELDPGIDWANFPPASSNEESSSAEGD